MREILTDLDLLTEGTLDLPSLQLDGVAFGADTAQFPRHKITEITHSPIVARSRSGIDIEPEYFDRAGRRLSLDEVIDSVINSSGMVHFATYISFKIREGRIVGFALYGAQLRHFDNLTTYADFCRSFGAADRVVPDEAYGDLMGYHHYYFGSRKCVAWSEFDRRVSLVNLGEYKGNDGSPAPESEVA